MMSSLSWSAPWEAHTAAGKSAANTQAFFVDKTLMLTTLLLLSIGVVMVASSSIDFAAWRYNDPWFFLKRHLVYLSLGAVVFTFFILVPLSVWQKYSGVLLLLAIFLLAVVLVPGIGKVVNGSRRWLSLGPLNFQASEASKVCLLLFFAGFLARRQDEVSRDWASFLKMVSILGLVVFLLLLEPDFGSAVVICATLASMMYVAGVRVFRFVLLVGAGVAGLAFIAVASPYRWERLVTFTDPWTRQFDSGYQLVQSLIAFGRGEWAGLGLGQSIQKLFFLPEAHTDFVFAILAEEFGFLGIVFMLGLFSLFIARLFFIGRAANNNGNLFASYLAFGIACMFALQAFINMGVASGLLPTKGLTLPFISYGGSSLLICLALTAMVFRIHHETQCEVFAPKKEKKKRRKGDSR